MIRWRMLAAAVGVVAGSCLLFPAVAGATPIPDVKIGPISIPIPTPTICPVAESSPPVHVPTEGLSGVFDGTPAVSPGAGASVYENMGPHPFAWYQYDPGCLGPSQNPPVMLDTWFGNQMFGAAQDLVALTSGVSRLVSNPTWLHVFDGLEQNLVSLLQQNIWDLFLPLSLILIGLLVVARSHRGHLASAVKIVAWTLLVVGVVAVVASEPTRVGRLADSMETQAVNAVPAALNGQQNAGGSAFGTEEVQYVLEPIWLRGELGASSGPVVDAYGQRLLGDTALTWAEAAADANGANTKLKQADFAARAAALSKQYPSSYSVLKGQGGSRAGLGAEAMFGSLMTAPFQLIADGLVVASLLLLRLLVVLFPLLAVIGIHYRFRGVLVKVGSMAAAALINAVVFSVASAVLVFLTGDLLTTPTIPAWFGLILVGLLALLLFYMLRPFRRLTHMVQASEVSHALHRAMLDVRHTASRAASTAAKAGTAAATGGSSAAALAVTREAIPEAAPGLAGEGARPDLGESSDGTTTDDDPQGPSAEEFVPHSEGWLAHNQTEGQRDDYDEVSA